MKKPKRGTTGLTQKEAIFQIIKRVAGDLYKPGFEMKPILWEQTDHSYGRARSPSCPFDKIVREVFEALSSGSIPSKLTSEYDRKEYASRIVHYWLKHDKRLNGGQPGTRMAKTKKKQIALLDRLSTDPVLKAMKTLQLTLEKEEDRREVESHIQGRIFTIILETHEVSLEAVPENIRNQLHLYTPEQPEIQLKDLKKAG